MKSNILAFCSSNPLDLDSLRKPGQASGGYWWKQLEGGRFRLETRFAIMKCATFSQSLMSQKLSLLICRPSTVLSLTNWGRSSWDEWGIGGARGETSASDVLPLCFSVMNPHLPRQTSIVVLSDFTSFWTFIFPFEKWTWSHLSSFFPSPGTLIWIISVRFSASDQKWDQFEKNGISLEAGFHFEKQRHYLSNQMFFPMMEVFSLKLSALFFPPSDRKWFPLSEPYITSEARQGKRAELAKSRGELNACTSHSG